MEKVMCLAAVCLLLVACSGVSQQDAEQTAMTFVKAQVKFYSTENVSAVNLPEYTVSVIESYRDTSGEWVVVVHDYLDLPLGSFKIVFNRGSGGHRGVESIRRAIKTEGFIRIKVGISPATPSGKTKQPKGEKAVNNFILGTFKPKELEVLKKVSKKVSGALTAIVAEGKERAMNEFN